jgi:hypothetical protein
VTGDELIDCTSAEESFGAAPSGNLHNWKKESVSPPLREGRSLSISISVDSRAAIATLARNPHNRLLREKQFPRVSTD